MQMEIKLIGENQNQDNIFTYLQLTSLSPLALNDRAQMVEEWPLIRKPGFLS